MTQGSSNKTKEGKSQEKEKKPSEKSEQIDAQQAYLKASPEEKRNKIFFKEVPVESVVDQQAIEECKKFGLYNLDPCFRTGKMSHELKQKMGYMKSKHRTDMLLRKWSQD